MEKILMIVKRLYLHIPICFLNVIAPLYYLLPEKIRFGKTYMETKKKIEDSKGISEIQYKELIDNNFKDLVEYCYKYVPYYRRIMDERNLSPVDFCTYKDIEKLPVLTKDIILKEGDQLISSEFKKERLIKKQTSGSTFTPMVFYQESSTEMVEWAYIMSLWSNVGYGINSSRLVLRAKPFRAQNKGNIVQWDAARKELSISTRDMTSVNCKQYCIAIDKYKPDYIYGYVSSIFELCQYIENNPVKHRFKAVLFISETVSSAVREYVERILNCPTYAFYGHSERAVIAGEILNGNCYYVEPTYGYVEILKNDWKPVVGDEKGEIVVTGFLNRAMPLIRYATGDIASWADENDAIINRFIKSIEGRTADYLVDKNGELINVTVIRDSQYGKYAVNNYQFVQNVIGEVILNVIPGDGWNEKIKKDLYEFVMQDTQNRIQFSIVECDHLIKHKNGKQRKVVSNLKIKRN